MKAIQLISTALLVALLLNPIASRAEDIDIYSGLGVTAGLPNVLIILDTAASNNSNTNGTCTYVGGGTPSYGTTLIGLEQCSLHNVIDSLPVNTDGTARVNIGIMTYNAGSNAFIPAVCAAVSTKGGCLVKPLAAMSSANKTALKSWIKTWPNTGSDKITTNGEATGQALQEAWAYYAGATGISGRNYASIKPASGCQKNFVIFLGNAYNPTGTPGDGGLGSTSMAAPDGKSNITIPSGKYGLPPANNSCGSYSMGTHSDGSGLYADEWARYMYQTDLYADPVTGPQNIVTYGIAALGPTCKPDYPALLKSVATYGGGKYFPVNGDDASQITQALLKVLNEVQAVNSVFASSSLPVSVNAQGTFLNQIYMGMFRPDASGLPRWVGNLKQYQFGYDQTTQTLSLVDSLGYSAISGAGTGFISPNAISFWTTKNTSVQPDLGGGYWRNAPQGAGVGYDSPDGELVEKGGAAQVIRLANLLDDYAANPRTPRKVYTYCPSGSSCDPILSASANAFASDNNDIAAGVFGASNVAIQSIVRTGTSALVTTNTSHGYITGNVVTISGATQPEYNVTQAITKNNNTSFFITGLPDYPATPTAGTYTIMLHNAIAQSVSTIKRSSSATSTANTETATVTTPVAHGFTTTAPDNSVSITGAVPTNYQGIKTVASVPSSTTFTFSIPVYPVTPAVNTYKAVIHPYSRSITGIVKSGSNGVVTTSAAHGFHVGQSVTISGATAYYNATWTIAAVTSTTFTFNISGNPANATSGNVSPSATPVTISTLTRTGTTVAATATATGLTAGYFANGDQVDISTIGTSANESGYVVTAAITCTTSPASTIGNPCTGTTFTYPITVTPALSASGTMQVALATTAVNIAAGDITRSGTPPTTVTVKNVTPGVFIDGSSVDISPSGTAYASGVGYIGTWTINCAGYLTCAQFTFGPVTLMPASPATGNMTAFSGQAAPDKTILVNWVRGQDNYGDEPSPDPTQAAINVRPSIHGDVLHSRPTVINYGGTTGVIVFYGANDGVYRSINGNQTNPTGSTLPVPGSELWSFIPTEFYGELTRMHDNSPVLQLASTPPGILPAPRKKNYFVDGSTSVYQKMNADGTTATAYLYLAMRRGGSFLYALDVTTPTNPKFLWKINNTSTDFSELGQTWSQPKVAFVKGYVNPVLIFGAGYDTAEDSQTPATDTMGRGIFIVDALDGHMVWQATYGTTSACTITSSAKAACTVAGMDYSIPADITLMDRSGNDGYIDRLYAVDTGGNIWRVDLEPTAGDTPDKWHVTQLAALGCDTGACSGTTPRKFFYAADMVPTTDYDAVLAGSGDREHPLYGDASYNVTNRFYMVKDLHTGNDATTTPLQPLITEKTVTPVTLVTTYNLLDITPVPPATTSTYDNSLKGYYITLGAGEKVVNAPLTVAGYTYFGTNTPATPISNSCTANLGIAKGYRIKPLTGTTDFVIYDGGGLPPSPVAGSVIVNVNGEEMTLPFCIGCGGDPGCVGSDCKTAIGGGKPPISVSTSRSRTYWYKEID